MILIKGIHKTYSSKYTGLQKVFDDFSIEFPSTGFVSVLGKSGCGKTTLLNIIGGIDSIDKGYINAFGYDISKYGNGNTLIDEYRRNVVGFVFQSYNLINNISVYRNLAITLEMQGCKEEEIDNKIKSVLDMVEMGDYLERMPYELSGGQQQRIAIARALIKESKVILADEPTGNLDSVTATEILKLLKDISKDRLVIFITHDQEYASVYSDSIIQIKDGKVVNDYSCINNKEDESVEKINSRIGLVSVTKNAVENFKLSLLKNILIVLLFSVTIAIISSSIAILTTTQNEILVEVIQSNEDELSTRVISAQVTTTDNGEEVLSSVRERENLYEIYNAYINLQDEYGKDNVILSSRVHLLNSYTTDGPLFDSMLLLSSLRINLLDSELDYDIPNLQGRMPTSSDEVVISDLLAFQLFGDDMAFGETVVFNRIKGSDTISDAELTVVGIVETDYVEQGYIDDETFFEDFYYNGNASISTRTYSFTDESVYTQLYGLEEMFENLDKYYDYAEHPYTEEPVHFQISTEGHYDRFHGTIINKKYVDLDSLIGGLPENENEIAVSKEQLIRVFPDNFDDITDLFAGAITWDEFSTIVDFSEVMIYYSNPVNEKHYQKILPESMTLVGAYEILEDAFTFSETVVLYEELIRALNNAYPYYDVSISFINDSPYLLEQIKDVTSDDFNALFYNIIANYEREVFITTEGSFNLFKVLLIVETSTIPAVKTILIGTILFTYVLMFLFSYLNVLNNQKRIGIFRSLGYRRNDIVTMFFIENGMILILSASMGGIVSLLALSQVNQTIFLDTIFSDLMLFSYEFDSILISFCVIVLLMISTSVFPLVKMLRLSPVNIINRD